MSEGTFAKDKSICKDANGDIVVCQKNSLNTVIKERADVENHSRVTFSRLFSMAADMFSDTNQSKETLPLVKVNIKDLKHKKHKNKKDTYGVYRIKRGDRLDSVAKKFNIKRKEILVLNGMKKNVKLSAGKKLKIPLSQKMVNSIVDAKYTIEGGDTLLSIANKFHLNPKTLVRFNRIKTNTTIKKGKKIRLPLPYVLKKIERDKKRIYKQKQEKLKQEKLKKAKLKQCKKKHKVKMLRGFGKRKLRVTATAYSSHSKQTDVTPFLAAWNNHLRPGMKIIAVSRDLLTRYGLHNGSKVRISGLSGFYRVRDKMNKRYKKRIDIYMGTDRERAIRWGRRSVMIYW